MTGSIPVAASSTVERRRSDAQSVSIIIEWENARLAEAERPMRMLASLATQLDELATISSRNAEIVLLFNPEAVDEEAIGGIIDHVRPRSHWPASFRLLPSGDLRYYEQKNYGVHSTTGDIVIFLDSDVVPEPDWLAKIHAAMEDPEVEVLCGSTYVDCTGFYDRAFALFWLFPLRTETDGLERADMFFANNVAFRRRVIEANPFPDLGTFRGQAGALSKVLAGKGIAIVRHQGARCAHPPPNGVRHFISRALCEGHDAGIRAVERRGRRLGKLARRSLRTFRQRMGRATSRIAQGYGTVGLSPVGVAGAWSLALAYNSLYLTGQLLAAIRPELVPRHFPIR
jgi:hypothetical protein